MASPVSLREDVEEALSSGSPVIALESTIIAHGMPYPRNVETALRAEAEGVKAKDPCGERGGAAVENAAFKHQTGDRFGPQRQRPADGRRCCGYDGDLHHMSAPELTGITDGPAHAWGKG